MTVQFKLGHGDHKVVEDFVSRGPVATSAITLDAKAARHQLGAAEAARERGMSVFYEVGVERLTEAGYGLEGFPLWTGAPYSIERLAGHAGARQDLVERVTALHPDIATHVTAPHVYVDSDRPARLNLDLAEVTRLHSTDRATRAVLTISHRYAKQHAAALAWEYMRAGVRELELRMSPFGGEDESLKKIRDGFAAAQAFTDAGLRVTLAHSGNLGQVAVALGHVESYSVGVGLLERVDHKAVINRQKQPPKERSEEDDDKDRGGPTAGVYLNGLELTAVLRVARPILGHSDLRIRVGCRHGRCGNSVRGPLLDARDHYLHSRDTGMAKLLSQPAGWRATSEIERLHAALSFREHINTHYLGSERLDIPVLKTRTLTSLISDIQEHRAAS